MSNGFDFLIYKAADEEVSVNAVIKDDTIWQQITDIFAECSVDYDKISDVTKRFYATVQNQFHYAITNQTVAEIIYDSADKSKENWAFHRYDILPDNGKVSHKRALDKAY